jgi:hypothetical protein
VSTSDPFEGWPDARAKAARTLKSACESFAAARRELNEPLEGLDAVVSENIGTLWMWIHRAGPEDCTTIADNLYPLIRRPTHDTDSPSYSVLLIDRAVSDVRDALDTLRAQPSPPSRLDLPTAESESGFYKLDQHAMDVREGTSLLQSEVNALSGNNFEVSALSGNKVEVNILSMRMGDLTLNLDLFDALRRSMIAVFDVFALDRVARSIANSSIQILGEAAGLSTKAVSYARRIVRSAQLFVEEVRSMGAAENVELAPVEFPTEIGDDELAEISKRLTYAEPHTLERYWLRRAHAMGPQVLAYLHASTHPYRANYFARRASVGDFAYEENTGRLHQFLISLLETSLRIPRGIDLEYISRELDGKNLIESKYSRAEWICPVPGSAFDPDRHMADDPRLERRLQKGMPIIPVRVGVRPTELTAADISDLRAVVVPFRREITFASLDNRLPGTDTSA